MREELAGLSVDVLLHLSRFRHGAVRGEILRAEIDEKSQPPPSISHNHVGINRDWMKHGWKVRHEQTPTRNDPKRQPASFPLLVAAFKPSFGYKGSGLSV